MLRSYLQNWDIDPTHEKSRDSDVVLAVALVSAP